MKKKSKYYLRLLKRCEEINFKELIEDFSLTIGALCILGFLGLILNVFGVI